MASSIAFIKNTSLGVLVPLRLEECFFLPEVDPVDRLDNTAGVIWGVTKLWIVGAFLLGTIPLMSFIDSLINSICLVIVAT